MGTNLLALEKAVRIRTNMRVLEKAVEAATNMLVLDEAVETRTACPKKNPFNQLAGG